MSLTSILILLSQLHSPQSSVKVKNECSSKSFHHICFHGVEREIFTFLPLTPIPCLQFDIFPSHSFHQSPVRIPLYRVLENKPDN
jgi:hypothetical protein